MNRRTNNTIYSWPVNNSYLPPSGIDITRIIDSTHLDSDMSSIDTFIQKNIDLNKLLIDSNKVKNKLEKLYKGRRLKKATYNSIINYIDDPLNIPPVLANLIVLGHISAVESYFREMFRKVILIDTVAQQACREKMVTYGAAVIHKREALPDAMLESITFSGSKNITESLKEYLGINSAFPSGFTQALKEYSKVCHLRHCIVHRFGKLGVNNAMRLDWEQHKSQIDKPIKIDFSALQEVSQICSNIVKEVNNFVWNMVMMRQITEIDGNVFKKKNVVEWKWKWVKDRIKFKKYFDIFYSTLASPAVSDIKMAYVNYKDKYNTLI